MNSEAILKKCIVGLYTGAPSTAASTGKYTLSWQPTSQQNVKCTLHCSTAKQVDIPSSSGREVEKGEEPGVISLTVPDISSQPSREAEKEETGMISISLTVPEASSQPNRKAESGVISLTAPDSGLPMGKWEESAVMSLKVPNKPLQTTGERLGTENGQGEVPGELMPMVTTPRPDYMITTWNSVTGYETSV